MCVVFSISNATTRPVEHVRVWCSGIGVFVFLLIHDTYRYRYCCLFLGRAYRTDVYVASVTNTTTHPTKRLLGIVYRIFSVSVR